MIATRLFSRAVIRLSATDDAENVFDFLQGLVTNDVKGDLPVWAALLSAQGKALFDFIVWKDGNDALIDCEAEYAADLVKRLSLYRLRRKITIAVDEALGVNWSIQAQEVASIDPRLPTLGLRWLTAASDSDVAADDAWLTHRLAHGVTEGRHDLGSDATLWLECNAVELSGVSFTKGCYIGQENTARMNWRQKVNRRLIVVPLAQSDEKHQRATYPQLGLAVDHLRIEDITPEMQPEWLTLDTAS